MKRTPAKDLSPADVVGLRRSLLEHYDEHRRSLPWRGEVDPYRVLVSEVMLQQTRVDTVRPYYERWIERFPDLESLAAADDGEVLKAWEGLGYYRRARNLHRAARMVRERPDGRVPATYEGLRGLPGVGAYTAGAVASIAFGESVPAVDGNARRVLARLFDEPDPKPAWLGARVSELLDPERPGDWNQALMELGATVCLPRAPRCGDCPVAHWCAARAGGTQGERPVAAAARSVPTKIFVLAVLTSGGRVMLERRPEDGLLGGLWSFPERVVRSAAGGAETVLSLAHEMGAGPLGEPRALPEVAHRFTHLEATYVPWVLEVEALPEGEGRQGVDPAGPLDLPLPVAQRRVLESLILP